MMTLSRSILSIGLCLFFGTLGCRRPAQGPIDACALLKNAEIEAVQGSPVKETKSSAQVKSGFRVAQCFYTATEFSKSVVLTVTQRDFEHPTSRTPKDFWNDMFGEHARDEKEGRGEREEEKVASPKKVEGIGDEAYWTGMRFGGALYVLKNNVFIRISVGGGDDEESRINRSKGLARKALGRL